MSVITDEEHEKIAADHAAGRHDDEPDTWGGNAHPACPECNSAALKLALERVDAAKALVAATTQMESALNLCLSAIGSMSESTLSRDRAFFMTEARRAEVTTTVTAALAAFSDAVKRVPK